MNSETKALARWKTKDGQVLRLSEMSESHIRNCIAMLERTLEKDPGEQVYMGDSDYAADAVESENRHNDVLRDYCHEWIGIFNAELTSRSPSLNEQ